MSESNLFTNSIWAHFEKGYKGRYDNKHYLGRYLEIVLNDYESLQKQTLICVCVNV